MQQRLCASVVSFTLGSLTLAALSLSALAVAPDLAVSQTPNALRWGQVGDTVGFSAAIGTCNLGDADATWTQGQGQYPIFVENLYRLEGNRFEQIGMSWAQHNVICALNAVGPAACGTCSGSGGCDPFLSPGCNNSNTAAGVGQQPQLGPRTEINPWTGDAPLPFTAAGQTGDAIYKRIQVAASDLDPALHAGARYFLETQVVAASEPSEARGNNATYREVLVTGAAGTFNLMMTGAAQLGVQAIRAWPAADPFVEIDDVPVTNDGRFTLAARVTQLAPMQWRYDYALHNLNSDRGARAFHVITGNAAITQPYFHDVSYHSGDTPDGTDWNFIPGGVTVRWETPTFAADPDANALRWGTLYNFSLVANQPPAAGFVIIELFKPGSPSLVNATTLGPSANGLIIGDMNCDGVVTVTDIGPFVLALTNPAQYAATFPGCDIVRGDCTGDGQVTVSDIGCFVNLLTGSN